MCWGSIDISKTNGFSLPIVSSSHYLVGVSCMLVRIVLVVGACLMIGLGTVAAVKQLTRRPASPVDATSPDGSVSPVGQSSSDKKDTTFDDKVKPFLVAYCANCHGGSRKTAGLAFDEIKDEKTALKNRQLWQNIAGYLTSREMPPPDKKQPKEEERQFMLKWIDEKLSKVDCSLTRDPGQPTLRRLNRTEYANTIRDLVGVKFDALSELPQDDSGYGFDNIGDVLSMPPILLERYLAASEKIVASAITLPEKIVTSRNEIRPPFFTVNGGAVKPPRPMMGMFPKIPPPITFSANGEAFMQTVHFSHEGEYAIKIRASGLKDGDTAPRMVVKIGDKEVKSFDVDAPEDKPKTFDFRVTQMPGDRRFSIALTNQGTDPKDPKKGKKLYLYYAEVEGPFNAKQKTPSASHQKIIIASPTGPNDKEPTARKVLEKFATKAFRRPVKKEETDRFVKLFKLADSQGEPFEKAIQLPLRAILVSPHFLFKVELDSDPNNPDAIHTVNDFELATRLSYFLWSTMPDDELYTLAEQGKLRQPATLDAQVRRMLKDPKSRALVDNFAQQWLNLRLFATINQDPKTFPNWSESLRADMIRETELYFEHVMREDRSVLDFLDSDYTFVNERLARHYGIGNVTGSEFRKVKFTDSNRGGILTHGSILTLTSNPTRTSPVKRGKWVLETILGTPPPPPPPEVPELKEDKDVVLKGSLRQRMEQHRTDPNCAVCHQKMDPLGFGLENFDGVGAWRQKDGKFTIDPSGELPNGDKFEGPSGLRKILLGKADQFRRTFSENLLIYALGRGTEYSDKCALDELVTKLKNNQDTFSVLVVAIVQSDAFQKRRGKKIEEK
jgi:hypothetical protein